MWRVLQAAASLKVMGWDPGQRPKWEIHQECIPFLSSPLFFSPSLRLWKNSCCYNSTVHIFLQSYTQPQGTRAVRQVPGSEVRRRGASLLSNIPNMKANSKQQTPVHARRNAVKRATRSWQTSKSLPWVEDGEYFTFFRASAFKREFSQVWCFSPRVVELRYLLFRQRISLWGLHKVKHSVSLFFCSALSYYYYSTLMLAGGGFTVSSPIIHV